MMYCYTCGRFWSGLVTLGGRGPGGQSPRSALPCSPCTEQRDGTAARAALAVDGHPRPLKLAGGEEAPAAGDGPDAGGQLVESHSHVGQGNQAGYSGSPGQTVTPLATLATCGGGIAWGQTDLRPGVPG